MKRLSSFKLAVQAGHVIVVQACIIDINRVTTIIYLPALAADIKSLALGRKSAIVEK
jgi:hypothetical protein